MDHHRSGLLAHVQEAEGLAAERVHDRVQKNLAQAFDDTDQESVLAQQLAGCEFSAWLSRKAGTLVNVQAGLSILAGALLEMVLVLANVGSAVVLLPLFRRGADHALSTAFLVARVIESTFIAAGILFVLGIVTLRHDDPGAASLATSLAAWTNALQLGMRLSRNGHFRMDDRFRSRVARFGVCSWRRGDHARRTLYTEGASALQAGLERRVANEAAVREGRKPRSDAQRNREILPQIQLIEAKISHLFAAVMPTLQSTLDPLDEAQRPLAATLMGSIDMAGQPRMLFSHLENAVQGQQWRVSGELALLAAEVEVSWEAATRAPQPQPVTSLMQVEISTRHSAMALAA